MSEFNPSPNDHIVIGGMTYKVMPHPAVPTFAFGQEGRKAFVFQLSASNGKGLYAIKKFKEAFRVPELVKICDDLARFSRWKGLEVCARQCLHFGRHDDALNQFPDLEFAVLMPWISGSTWYDIVISERPLSRLAALTFANATAQVLSALEEAGLAHCDVAAPNIIINPAAGTAHLIDIEDLYVSDFEPPSALPAGTPGYDHHTASEGLWKATADRFAGAVLMSEMAAWHVPEIRKEADEEHYFAANEMQQDSPRYQLMRDVLVDMHPILGELLDQAWYSGTLEDCPPLKAWYEVINDIFRQEQLSEVVSDWQPISVPTQMEDAAPRPFVPAPIPEPEESPAPVIEEGERVDAPEPAAELLESELDEAEFIPPPGPIEVEAPPPPPPSTPIQSPPEPPASGGPVVEWRPLDLSAMANHRSTPPRVEHKPLEIEEPAPAAETAVHQPIIVPDHEPAFEIEPLDGYGEESGPAGEYEESFAPPPEAEVSLRLFKPVLDLSHIDVRNRPHLVWSESPDAEDYELEEANVPNFRGAKAFKIKANTTQWNPRTRRSGRLFYRVRAAAEDQIGPWSEVLSIRIGKS